MMLTLLTSPAHSQTQQEELSNIIASAQGIAAKAHEAADFSAFNIWNIDPALYSQALNDNSFYAPHWDQIVKIDYIIETESTGTCAGAYAYVRHQETGPNQLSASIHICPYFFEASSYVKLETILHEMVHALTGVGECRAMAYTFALTQFGMGIAYLDEAVWAKNNCETSDYNIFK